MRTTTALLRINTGSLTIHATLSGGVIKPATNPFCRFEIAPRSQAIQHRFLRSCQHLPPCQEQLIGGYGLCPSKRWGWWDLRRVHRQEPSAPYRQCTDSDVCDACHACVWLLSQGRQGCVLTPSAYGDNEQAGSSHCRRALRPISA